LPLQKDGRKKRRHAKYTLPQEAEHASHAALQLLLFRRCSISLLPSSLGRQWDEIHFLFDVVPPLQTDSVCTGVSLDKSPLEHKQIRDFGLRDDPTTFERFKKSLMSF
jgi:hypothetical protein